jgi:hypothetical protein
MLLHAGTRRVGIVHAHGCNIVDVLSDFDSSATYPWPVRFPAPGQHDVPLGFAGEWPDPLPPDVRRAGFPITLSFGTNPVRVEDAKASLRAGAAEIPVALSWPGRPAADRFPDNFNAIALIPLVRLEPLTRHDVEVKARIDGRERELRWSFFTGRGRAGASWRRRD